MEPANGSCAVCQSRAWKCAQGPENFLKMSGEAAVEMVTSPASVGGTGEVTGAALHGFCLFFLICLHECWLWISQPFEEGWGWGNAAWPPPSTPAGRALGLTGGFACLPCSLLIEAEAWSTRGRFSSPLGGKTRSELELEPWGSCWAWTVPGASCRGASAVTKPRGLELSWWNGLRRERGRDAEAPVSPWKCSRRRARLLPRRGLELSSGGLLAAWFGLSKAQRQAAGLISGKRLAGFLQHISLSSLDRQLGNFKKSSQKMSHSVCKWEK